MKNSTPHGCVMLQQFPSTYPSFYQEALLLGDSRYYIELIALS